MKRHRSFILALVFLAACAHSAPQRSALEQAKLAYVDASIAYESSMQTVVELRSQRVIDDANWERAMKANLIVRRVSQRFRDSLDLWESLGSKPPSYDQVVEQLVEAMQTIVEILAEVKR